MKNIIIWEDIIMPRGRKKMEKITLEEQLALVDKEIEATESSLKNLRLKRKDLKIKIEEHQKDELYRLVQNSGKSLEEVIAMLKEEN